MLPWQMNNIFIILNLSFHKPLNLHISGFLALFFNFAFCPNFTQIYINLRKFMGKWCSKWCSRLVYFSTWFSLFSLHISIFTRRILLRCPALVKHICKQCAFLVARSNQWFSPFAPLPSQSWHECKHSV